MPQRGHLAFKIHKYNHEKQMPSIWPRIILSYPSPFFTKTLILAYEANSAMSRKLHFFLRILEHTMHNLSLIHI